MKLSTIGFLTLLFWALGSGGCARSSSTPPLHDEVLVFSLPMDLVYLRTMEAIELDPDWGMDHTIKEKGLIYLRNLRYSSFADSDRRRATLVLKRTGPRRTSIQLAKESQSIVGGGELLALIKRQLSSEVSRK